VPCEEDSCRHREQPTGADQRGGPVAQDPLAQTEQCAKTSGQADRQQADRTGLLNGQAKPEDQQRHANDATAGTGQGEDQPDSRTEQRGDDCGVAQYRHRRLRSC